MSQPEQNNSLPLPEELQLQIFSFLDPLSLLNVRYTSKDMFRITSEPILWKNFLNSLNANNQSFQDVITAMKESFDSLLQLLPQDSRKALSEYYVMANHGGVYHVLLAQNMGQDIPDVWAPAWEPVARKAIQGPNAAKDLNIPEITIVDEDKIPEEQVDPHVRTMDPAEPHVWTPVWNADVTHDSQAQQTQAIEPQNGTIFENVIALIYKYYPEYASKLGIGDLATLQLPAFKEFLNNFEQLEAANVALFKQSLNTDFYDLGTDVEIDPFSISDLLLGSFDETECLA